MSTKRDSRLLADAETVREYRERVDIAFHGYHIGPLRGPQVNPRRLGR